jgi:hypothetical protein
VNIITVQTMTVQTMTNSQVQVGSHGSSQHCSHGIDSAALLELVSEIRQSTEISADTGAQLDGLLDVVAELAHSSQPDQAKLRKLLGSVKAVLEGAGGTLLAAKVATLLTGF